MRINILHVVLATLLLIDGCKSDTENENKFLPACIANAFPISGSLVAENGTIILSWTPSAGVHSYDIFLGTGTNEPTLFASDITATTYSYTVPPGIGISYSWYVKPKNSNGSYIDCREYSNNFKAQDIPALDAQQKVVKVLVLDYDPEMSFSGGPGIKLHSFMSWSDPRTLANEFINDVLTSSDSLIQYQIVEWRELDEFPVKKDGFLYTDSTYFLCMFGGGGNKAGCHAPDDLDYAHMIDDQKITEGINQDIYEEVWIFGAPYFGFWESAMAGPNAFYINGGIFDQVKSKKAFAIMGFSYERGVAEMIHDLCHRTESTMAYVYGGWRAEELTTSWARFAANQKQSGVAAVGSCHYPPNAGSDYDYASKFPVMSSADDWLNYPIVTGHMRSINSDEWGGPDYQRNYLNWWFSHLPRREGVAPDGKLNNWWRYIYEFNENIIQ